MFGKLGNLAERLFRPEVAAYNWMHEKIASLFGASHSSDAAATATAATVDVHNLPANEYHFVDYFAKSCPHCVDLAPKWEEAVKQWGAIEAGLPAGSAKPKIVFETKECLDGDWKAGTAHEECQAEGVHAFPSIKFFGPNGEETQFEGPRTATTLIKFAKQHTGLEAPSKEFEKIAEPEMQAPVFETPAQHVTPAEDRVVEYYAASCPHCTPTWKAPDAHITISQVKLTPTWKDAEAQWGQEHQDAKVQWVQKECLDGEWKPGKDFDDCIKEEVQAFPAIRFEGKNGTVHEFDGPRNVKGLQEFTAKELKEVEAIPAIAAKPAEAAEPVPVEEHANVAEAAVGKEVDAAAKILADGVPAEAAAKMAGFNEVGLAAVAVAASALQRREKVKAFL